VNYLRTCISFTCGSGGGAQVCVCTVRRWRWWRNGSLTVARAKKRIERCVADAGIEYPVRPRKYDGGDGAVTKSAAQGGARLATIARVCWSVGVSGPRPPRDRPPTRRALGGGGPRLPALPPRNITTCQTRQTPAARDRWP